MLILISKLEAKIKMKPSTKERWINEIIVAILIFLIKNVLLQPKFEKRLKLHVNLYIMDRLFSMYTIID